MKRILPVALAFASFGYAFGAAVIAEGPWFLRSDTWKPGVYEWNGLGKTITPSVTDWSPESYYFWSGDGNLTACGPGGKPLSTLRLENFRDGLEDYHYALILEKRLAARPDAPWAAKARELLAVPDEVVTSLKAFTTEPEVYRRWRDALADAIEASR